MSGQKIIEGLKQATEGDFSRVTIEGQVWVREEELKQAQACCDSYAAENQRFSDEIEHLKNSELAWKVIAKKAEKENGRLRAALEPFVRGLNIHESGACVTENLPLPADTETAKNVYVGDQRVARDALKSQ